MNQKAALLSSISTPFYYYDLELLKETLKTVKTEADLYGYKVHYAVKANANPRILEEVQAYGFGADCVSGNEVHHAIEHGFAPEQVVFAGVGKTDEEILLSLSYGISCFNVESIEELEVLNELAIQKGKVAKIALRLNPNVQADTHKYITTGLNENKFGIGLYQLDAALALLERCEGVELDGLHFHIGSQITDLENFRSLCARVNEIQLDMEAKGITLSHINVGGGLGINYEQPDEEPIADFKGYFAVFNEYLELRPGQELHFELGRSITGNCGSLITKVLYVKKGLEKQFAIVDAGMTDLVRPALYQSFHKIENISSEVEQEETYDVVGPICESSDCFGEHVALPQTKRGDYLEIRSAGAYGEIMASGYNLRTRAKSFFSDEVQIGRSVRFVNQRLDNVLNVSKDKVFV